MKLVSKPISLEIKGEEVILHEDVANELGINYGDRITIRHDEESITAFIGVSSKLVDKGEIGFLDEARKKLELSEGVEVSVFPAKKPVSTEFIRKKIKGKELGEEEIRSLIEDVVCDRLTNIEIASYLTALEINEMSLNEIEWLTRAMVDSGETIRFDKFPILDKHSIGGVPGNKISLLIVPIIASAGYKIPKTSSRAITGAAGTADIMEVLSNVRFTAEEIKELTEEVGGALAWGGATNISPADDIFVRVEHPLSLDPRPQLLASVLSKKKAIGSDKVVIDIPVGDGAKVEDRDHGTKLCRDFNELGKRLSMDVECVITYGGNVIGDSIGPALEAKEALRALERKDAPKNLLEKSFSVAGVLLEMADESIGSGGKEVAEKYLKNGDALEKFREIMGAQGGDESVSSEDIEVGEEVKELRAPSSGHINKVYTTKLVKYARSLGAPSDKGAGIRVFKKEGDKVEEDDLLIKLFAEERWRLEEVLEQIKQDFPLDVEGTILDRVPKYREISD